MDIINVVNSLTKHKTKKYRSRRIDGIKYIVVHHTLTGPSAMPRAIANYHVHTNNWPGIGYAYFIASDGRVFKTNNVGTMSYHVGKYNRESLGICLAGNFDTGVPTEKQLQSLVTLITAIIQSMRGIITDIDTQVIGHNDVPGYSWKSCPGKKFYSGGYMRRLRESVKINLGN